MTEGSSAEALFAVKWSCKSFTVKENIGKIHTSYIEEYNTKIVCFKKG